MADEKKKYDPTKKFGRLLPQSKTTLKQRLAKSDAYFKLDPKVRSKIRKKKYDSLSDTQKKTLGGIKTAAEVASYFLPGGALRLAVPVVRAIQATKTGFKVGNKTYKTLKEATAAKNKLKKVVNTKAKSIDPKTKKLRPVQDKKKTKKATTNLKSQTTRDLTKQQKALKTKQDKTTKILKDSSNLAFGIGGAAAAEKLIDRKTVLKKKPKDKKDSVLSRKRNIDTRRSPGALGGRVETKTDKNKRQVSNAVAGPSISSPKRPASIKAGSGKGLGTLSEIASKYGTTIKELMKANKDITDADKIQKGQDIKLGKVVKNRKSVYQKKSGGPVVKKMGGGKVYRRGGGKALRGFGKATYSDKMY